MMARLILSPPIAFILFLGLLTVIYLFLRKYSAKGPDHPDKHLPYSGGQRLPPLEVRLSYTTYFRLGLLFGVTHVAVLVLATFPMGIGNAGLGLVYLVGFTISALVLAQRKPD
jgi:NADH:ubiquinone oxidoreductase subunit 3 (subunit A)